MKGLKDYKWNWFFFIFSLNTKNITNPSIKKQVFIEKITFDPDFISMDPITVYKDTRALIFDIDGTLVDTMSVHYKACQIVCNEFGFDFPLDFFYKYAGVPTLKTFDILMDQLGLKLDGQMLGKLKEEKYVELIHEVKPMKEVYEVARQFHGKLPMALGTGSTKEIALKTLSAAGIENMFEIIVTADDVQNHKPAPDTFLLCAEKMRIEPEYCQVFEDADPGIKAAQTAGMMFTDIRKFIKQMQ